MTLDLGSACKIIFHITSPAAVKHPGGRVILVEYLVKY
jgi:hypothetical protein